jgi:uncharacterized repeat protein (TIGR03803 family)
MDRDSSLELCKQRCPYERFLSSAVLILDSNGNLDGTTGGGGVSGSGTVFQLAPPSTIGGNWTLSILWSPADSTEGNGLVSGLILDSSGNLYGSTKLGGASSGPQNAGAGTVFELMPPSMVGGSWTHSILWNFSSAGTDGQHPVSGLIKDNNGNLYGTTVDGGTSNGGTVFVLNRPPSNDGNWTESILWNFSTKGTDGNGPFGGVVMDASGNLYGTAAAGGAYQHGTAFELTPPANVGGKWIRSVLWSFGKGLNRKGIGTDGGAPESSLLMDGSHNLFGTTQTGGTFGLGTVFEITNPGPITTTLTPSPASLNFGNVAATKTSKPKRVKLTNTGTNPAQLSDVTVSSPFTIVSRADTCSGHGIAPKRSCSMYIEFAPSMAGLVNDGSIDVPYNGPSPAVTLAGNGT